MTMRAFATQPVWEALEAQALGRGDAHHQAFAALDTAGRAEFVEEAAIELARGVDDPRLVELCALVATPAAYAAIDQALSGPPLTSVAAARALWKAVKDVRALAVLARVGRVGAPLAVEAAVPGLLEIGSAAALEVVAEILGATDGAAQVLAIDLLFMHLGLERYDRIPTGPVWRLRLGLSSRLTSIRAAALTRLRELIGLRLGGADDGQLGIVAVAHDLSPEMLTIVRAVRDPSKGFEEAALDALQGDEREWAVDLAMKAVERGEARGGAALARLGGARATMALEDLQAGRLRPVQ